MKTPIPFDRPREAGPSLFQTHFRDRCGRISYLVAHCQSRAAVLIDPAYDVLARYEALFDAMAFTPRFVLDTGSGITGADVARVLAERHECIWGVPQDADRVGAVTRIAHGDRIEGGGLVVQAVGRPGQVQSRISYRIADRLFVGNQCLRAEPSILDLPVDTMVYRSEEVGGRYFGLLGLEAASSMAERQRWVLKGAGAAMEREERQRDRQRGSGPDSEPWWWRAEDVVG